ncbi:MAG: hypothetical protein FWG47_03120 [Propionibacteriaceae bacterium]|nr:hypothetical protein [Propionibacteriaceae bacterium]
MDILIRDIPGEVVNRLDREAKNVGISRNSYLVDRLTELTPPRHQLALEMLNEAAAASKCLLDTSFVAQMWS